MTQAAKFSEFRLANSLNCSNRWTVFITSQCEVHITPDSVPLRHVAYGAQRALCAPIHSQYGVSIRREHHSTRMMLESSRASCHWTTSK